MLWLLEFLKKVSSFQQITLILLIIAALFLIGFRSGYKLASLRIDADYKIQYEALTKQIADLQISNQRASLKYAQDLKNYNKRQVSDVDIQKEIDKGGASDVYNTCILPDAGVQFINSAVNAVHSTQPT